MNANQEKDFDLSTKKFAELNGINPGSVHARVSVHGHYFGVKPIKLANGRLMWPATQVKA